VLLTYIEPCHEVEATENEVLGWKRCT